MKTKEKESCKNKTPIVVLKKLHFSLIVLTAIIFSEASFANDEASLVALKNTAPITTEDKTEYPNNYNGHCGEGASGNDSELLNGSLPQIRPIAGDKTVVCTTVPDTPELAKKCAKMIDSVAKFYSSNSREQLRLTYKASGGGDFRFRVNPALHNNNVTWQSQFLSSVARHEFGHKIGLGHSSRTETGRQHDPNKHHYDTTTIMNGHAIGSQYLNAIQYYLKGWLPEDEVAHYDGASASTYSLSRISDFEGSDLSTVVVTPDHYPTLFISWPPLDHCKQSGQTKCFTVHYLRSKSATRQLATQDNGEFCMPEIGLKIRMLPNADADKISIELDRY